LPRLTDFSDHKEDPGPTLSHEGLDVYRVSLDFTEYVEEILVGLPKEYSHLSSQLRRSSSSIVLNIAEGSGRASPNDRAHFYIIARGSATESSATLDVLYRSKRLSTENWVRGAALVKRIVPMLSKLAKSVGAMSK